MTAPDEPSAPEFPVRLQAAPRIGAIYWCEFPADARRPEFWKTRPVVVVSAQNTLHGPVQVVPLTTKPQGSNPWAYAFSRNPVPRETRPSWAVCDHVTTVSCSRLTPDRGRVPRVEDADLQAVLALVRRRIPAPRPQA